jgi:LPXTG-motif cell wall-anchored protein
MALSLEPTHELTLHRAHASDPAGYTPTTFESLPAQPLFDDVNGVYWHEEMPQHGVLLEPTGTTVELISMNEQCDGTHSATLSINGAEVEAPEPEVCGTPTPTLPPTGGENSASLAGIGLAAILAGGLLVALAARRLRQD